MADCPSCGESNPARAKFCLECGAPLLGVRGPPPVEERKVVSVLFCDLVGFTARSERQDPEDVRARIQPYHARLRREIERYGGTVEKFVGDAVMAVFGAPVAHEDDAERAVRAGLAVLEAIAELNDGDPQLDLQVRVGINSGEAVVSVGAQAERGEGIVTGDVVNTAARIQTAAPVDAVAVGEETFRATSRIFDYEPLPAVVAKGKQEPLALWRADRARARFGSDVRGTFNTPFVGRELEKPLLIATFERAAQLRALQLVTIVGEPGVGKTRLIGELLAYVHAKPELTRWKQGRCLPYGEGITFWALGEIVKAEAGILESDTGEVAAAKLADTIPSDDPERPWLLQRLSPLVGVEAAPPAERQELFTAWRRFLEMLASSRPTVLVFEDLHWADEALLDFVEHLAEWSHDVPLLVVCAARPELFERRQSWGAGQRNAQTINLAPLSDHETGELVSYLTRSAALSRELQLAVLERVGGNPLYAEEFVRLLLDRGLDPASESFDEAALPVSVQALIAARLDTLPAERKSLLQDAAVVGKVFWAGAVASMSGQPEEQVEAALHELARKELIRPARASSMAGESEYSFWHLLVRDVAYGQIPRGERARRHSAAAHWIEQKSGDRVEDLAEVLAHHYVQALELARAAGQRDEAEALAEPAQRFLALAGERALGLDAAQAEARLAGALRLAPVDDQQRPELVVRWADAAFQAGRVRDAAEALDQALPELASQETAGRALQLRSRIAVQLGEGRQGALAASAVELLEGKVPTKALVDAYTQLAHAQCLAGNYSEAVSAADHALALARELGLPEPGRAVSYRGHARARLGSSDGLTEMERAVSLLVAQGAGREAAGTQSNLAIGRHAIYGPAAALAVFEEALRFSRRRGLAEVAAHIESNCALQLAELGRTDEALELIAKLERQLKAIGLVHSLIEPRSVGLRVRLERGEDPAALRTEVDQLLEAARNAATADVIAIALPAAAAVLARGAPATAVALLSELDQTTGIAESPYYAGELPLSIRTALTADNPGLAQRLTQRIRAHYPLEEHALCTARAQLAAYTSDYEQAATFYAEAAERWKTFGHLPEQAYSLLGQGQALNALGGSAPAEAPLLKARELFESMGYQLALAETNRRLSRAGRVRSS